MLFWIAFHIGIAALLVCDFCLFQQKGGLGLKKAWLLSGFWILLALIFNGLLYFYWGEEKAVSFFTAYLVEKSLSIDNLFVFLVIFRQQQLSAELQRKVLFWGILGAILFRAVLILLGIQLLTSFHWMIYLLGAFLCITGIRLLRKETIDKQNFMSRLIAFLPVSQKKGSPDFFVKEQGRFKATPLFLALITIEGTDILFALDSIPAVLAITTDPFIAYTSNIFAILGLRALYFAITPLFEKFSYVKIGLAAILVFVGLKMLLSEIISISVLFSLLIIAAILIVTIGCSWLRRER